MTPQSKSLTPGHRRTVLAAALVAAAGVALPGCAPLIVGGAMVGGTMMVIDRRTSGAQIEDQSIELKMGSRARELSPSGRINATSYNRMLLLSGEVPNESDRKALEQAAGRIENVRSIVNELAVMETASMGTRSNDAVLSARVKASFVDAKDLQAQAIKVTTDRGIVYLMGLVTEREAARAAEVARAVSGVNKVVRVFEMISEAELANLENRNK